MCTVTVGLPVYNSAPFLADAIQSVLNQTLTDWELLIVDDGSTDASLAIAWSFSDPRIRVMSDGINRGIAARLNQIAGMATGYYLARMDADDIMTPDRLELQVAYLTASPRTNVVGAFAYTIDTQNQVYGMRGSSRLPVTLSQVAGGVTLIHPTVLATSHWFRQHLYREECRRAEDFDLWLRTFEVVSVHVIARPLLLYRERGLPHLKKYVDTARDVRATLRRLPRQALTPWRFGQLMFLSYSREIVYRIMARAGRVNWLLHRRNRSLTLEEQLRGQAILNQSIEPVTTPILIG